MRAGGSRYPSLLSNPPVKPSDNDPSKPKPSPSTLHGTAALRAVLAGVSIEICGSTLLSLILRMLYLAQVGRPDMTPAQIADALRDMPHQSPLASLGILLGALVSVAAGYVCARIARRDEYVVGAIMAVSTTLICLVLEDTSRVPIDLTLMFILSDIACNLLGVKYAVRHNRLRAAAAATPLDTRTP